MSRSGFIVGFLAIFAAGSARAADSYIIEAPRAVMAGDRGSEIGVDAPGAEVDRYLLEAPGSAIADGDGIAITVVPRAGSSVDLSRHEIRFLNLPSGVTVTPPPKETGWEVSGPTSFRILVKPSDNPRPLSLVVQKRDDPSVQGSAVIRLELPPDRFIVTSLPPRVGDGSPRLMVVVLDARGMVVTSFQGDVELISSENSLADTRIEGKDFVDGVAEVSMRLRGPTAVRKVRVTARWGSIRGEGSLLIKHSGGAP